MQGIVTIIPQPFYQQIEKTWEDIESLFDLVGFVVSPIPHFSWHIAESYNREKLDHSISKTIIEIPPFKIRTIGLGLFPGTQSIVYIPIIKDCLLSEFHKHIWQAVEPFSKGSNYLYSPDLWVPHITLIHENLTPDKIGPVIKHLSTKNYSWEISIDHLDLITDTLEDGNCLNVLSSYPLPDNAKKP